MFGFLCTKIDPTDPLYYEEVQARKNNQPFAPEASRFCTVCQTYVQEKTKHCGCCNRCVDQFDHHCQWLNNCIGGLNYRYFIYLTISLFCLTILGTIACIQFFAQMVNDYDGFLLQVDNSSMGYNEDTALTFIITFFMFDPFIIPFITDIILYHAWLKYKNLSTYEHIMIKRERLELQEIEKQRKKIQSQKEKDLKLRSKKSKVIQDISQNKNKQLIKSQNSKKSLENNQNQNKKQNNNNDVLVENSNLKTNNNNHNRTIDLSLNNNDNSNVNIISQPFNSNTIDIGDINNNEKPAVPLPKNKLPPLATKLSKQKQQLQDNISKKEKQQVINTKQIDKNMSPLKLHKNKQSNDTQEGLNNYSNILGSGAINTDINDKSQELVTNYNSKQQQNNQDIEQIESQESLGSLNNQNVQNVEQQKQNSQQEQISEDENIQEIQEQELQQEYEQEEEHKSQVVMIKSSIIQQEEEEKSLQQIQYKDGFQSQNELENNNLNEQQLQKIQTEENIVKFNNFSLDKQDGQKNNENKDNNDSDINSQITQSQQSYQDLNKDNSVPAIQ